MPLYLLDTNILIDLTGEKKSRCFFEKTVAQTRFRVGTSILCIAEFMAGSKAREEKLLKEWIGNDELDIFYIDALSDAYEAGKIRRELKLPFPDAFILATSLKHNAHLLTHDALFLQKAKTIVPASDPISS